MTALIGQEYINQIWSQGYQTLSWMNSIPYALVSSAPAAEIAQQSLLNAANSIGIASFINAIFSQIVSLQDILALPVNLGTTTGVINSRLTALESMSSSLQGLLPPAPTIAAATLLNNGEYSVPFSDYIAYFAAFSGETNPLYTQSGVAYNNAQWASAVSILNSFYGSNPTQLYDTAFAINATNNVIYGIISGFVPVYGTLSEQYIYNQSYSLPASFLSADLISLSLGLTVNQQNLAARNALLQMASLMQNTLLISDTPTAFPPVQTTIVYGGETLQDIAARTLGNFELWEQIAVLNNIVPGGTLIPGTQLFLPPIAPSGQTAINYNINVLGQDLYIGDINEEMPPWTGDFLTISGPNNLIYALGRRLQTTLGTFTFHTDYGSRIPPEIGAVQTLNTALQIGAFMKSCMLTDPRVASVSNVQVSSGAGFGAINVVASAVPIGPNQPPVLVNEVITPR